MYVEFEIVPQFIADLAACSAGSNDTLMVLLAKLHADCLDDIIVGLNAAGVLFFGGIFPGLIDVERRCDSGAAVRSRRLCCASQVVHLDTGVRWQGEAPNVPAAELPPTLICLIDFLSRQTSQLLEDLFDRYSGRVRYFGAGCGHATRTPQPAVFTADGAYCEAAIAALADRTSAVTVRHGWQRKDSPYVATHTEGNVIHELDWEPAASVYRRALAVNLPEEVDTPECLGVTKRFPFGIARERAEDVVNDPLFFTPHGNGLACLSAVPEYCVLHILSATSENPVDAGYQAIDDLHAAGLNNADTALVFDCLSRCTLLGDGSGQELELLTEQLSPLAGSALQGALALAEIASDGITRPEFYNKTMTVALLHG